MILIVVLLLFLVRVGLKLTLVGMRVSSYAYKRLKRIREDRVGVKKDSAVVAGAKTTVATVGKVAKVSLEIIIGLLDKAIGILNKLLLSMGTVAIIVEAILAFVLVGGAGYFVMFMMDDEENRYDLESHQELVEVIAGVGNQTASTGGTWEDFLDSLFGNSDSDDDTGGGTGGTGGGTGGTGGGTGGTGSSVGTPGWSGNGFALNAMDIYSKYEYDGTGGDAGVSINGVTLYTGIPWEDDGNWYEFSIGAASSYLDYNVGKGLSTRSSVHTDNYNSGSGIVKEGVNCVGIAWMPIFCFLNVNDDGSFSQAYTSGLCNKYYGVVILEKDGVTYYMPVCSGGDNKGHTFPGGLAQTYIAHETTVDLEYGVVSLDAGTNPNDLALLDWDGIDMEGHAVSVEDFRNNWKTAVTYQGAVVGNCGHPSLTIECHANFKSALAGYSIKGYIMHKTN